MIGLILGVILGMGYGQAHGQLETEQLGDFAAAAPILRKCETIELKSAGFNMGFMKGLLSFQNKEHVTDQEVPFIVKRYTKSWIANLLNREFVTDLNAITWKGIRTTGEKFEPIYYRWRDGFDSVTISAIDGFTLIYIDKGSLAGELKSLEAANAEVRKVLSRCLRVSERPESKLELKSFSQKDHRTIWFGGYFYTLVGKPGARDVPFSYQPVVNCATNGRIYLILIEHAFGVKGVEPYWGNDAKPNPHLVPYPFRSRFTFTADDYDLSQIPPIPEK